MSYTYWENMLANPVAAHAREFRITTTPEEGYYRTHRLNEPVAIWEDGPLGMIILVNGIEIDEGDHETVWLNCAKHPVTEEAYHQAVETGRWDDLDDAVAAIGDNRRRGDDAAAIIDDLAGQAAKYFEITDDDEARRAISLRAALQEQGGKVDKVREAEKAPHLKAAREVDEIYMTTVKLAKTWADYLRHLVEAFETKKRVAAREAAFRADMARLANTPPTIEVFPQPADQIRTGYGRAASVREKNVVVGIHDIRMVMQHFELRAEMKEFLIELAQKDTDAGLTVPGVITETQAIIR